MAPKQALQIMLKKLSKTLQVLQKCCINKLIIVKGKDQFKASKTKYFNKYIIIGLIKIAISSKIYYKVN